MSNTSTWRLWTLLVLVIELLNSIFASNALFFCMMVSHGIDSHSRTRSPRSIGQRREPCAGSLRDAVGRSESHHRHFFCEGFMVLLPSCCQGDIRSGYPSWAYHRILQNLPQDTAHLCCKGCAIREISCAGRRLRDH